MLHHCGRAVGLVFLLLTASLSGCFGEEQVSEVSPSELVISNEILHAGKWQPIEFRAKTDLSLFIPYFVQDIGSLRAQNGTILDLRSGEGVTVNTLLPPRISDVVFLIGTYGQDVWPIRASD